MTLTLGRRHFSVKRNKQRGNNREKIAQKWLEENNFSKILRFSSSAHFDFKCMHNGKTVLIEHKSCLDKVYNGKGTVTHGRFYVRMYNHRDLKTMDADEILYLFQLVKRDKKYFIFKKIPEVDKLLADAKGKICKIPFCEVFPQDLS